MTTMLLQIYGRLLVIATLSLLSNVSYYHKLFSQITLQNGNGMILYVSGMINILLGLMLVLNGNFSGSLSDILVATLGSLSLLKGIFLLVSPSMSIARLKVKVGTPTRIIISCVSGLVLGIFLVYVSWF